jgi:ribonuclease HI
MTLVKDNVAGLRATAASRVDMGVDRTTEVQHIRVKVGDEDISISNVYVPPIWNTAGETRVQGFCPAVTMQRILEAAESRQQHIICGDFNSHHPVWDVQAEEDQAGAGIMDWCMGAHYMVGNDGRPTFRSTRDGRQTAPDLTLYSMGLSIEKWATTQRLTSPHLPVQFVVRTAKESEYRKRTSARRTVYSFKSMDGEKWHRFNSVIRRSMKKWRRPDPADSNYVQRLSDRFEGCVVKAAKKVIPRGCRTDPVPWWCKEIDEAMMARDQLEDQVGDDPGSKQRWVEAQDNVRRVIREKRTEFWQRTAEGLSYHTQPSQTVRTIKAIGREPRTTTTTILVGKGGEELVSDSAKAAALNSQYARVSSRRSRSGRGVRPGAVHRERRMELKLKKGVDSRIKSGVGPSEGEFTTAELRHAIAGLKVGKAPGKEGIHNEMLKQLDADNQQALLELVNASWCRGISPRSWLAGRIIPIPKPGKDKTRLESYRPVCLMSVVAKTAEAMITGRMRWILERGRGDGSPRLSMLQSGFREGRSTEDVLMKLVSDAQGGFHHKPQQQTLAVLVDLSRAFDRVDPNLLLWRMTEAGLPGRYVNWYKGFLSDRQYTTVYGESESRPRRFACGVPQGSVSGPLLFLVYIDILLDRLEGIGEEEGAGTKLRAAAFADDVTLWATGSDRGALRGVMQKGLRMIDGWARFFRMTVSGEKTEAIILTTEGKTHMQEMAVKSRSLKIARRKVRYKSEVKLLGVVVDMGLTFRSHAEELKKRVAVRIHQLGGISGKDWGAGPATLRSSYISYVRSVLEYGSSVWFPFLSSQVLDSIEARQLTAARIITGCIRSTDKESLLLEAALVPLSVRYNGSVAVAAERARCFPPDDRLYRLAAGPEPGRRLKKGDGRHSSWQHASEEVLVAHGINPSRSRTGTLDGYIMGMARGPAGTPILTRDPRAPGIRVRPWYVQDEVMSRILFHCHIRGGYRKDLAEAEKRAKALATIQYRWDTDGPFALEVWTDGSVVDEVGVGAAHVYAQGEGSEGVVARITVPAGNLCTSYRAEMTAIGAALEEVVHRCGAADQRESILQPGDRVLICTDSQSSISRLSRGPLGQTSGLEVKVWQLLMWLSRELQVTVVTQFVPSHCGLEKNDAVDLAAGSAMRKLMPLQHEVEVSLEMVRAKVRRSSAEAWRQGLSKDTPRYRVCGHRPTRLLDQGSKGGSLSRADMVRLARLRTGEAYEVGLFMGRLGMLAGGSCRWCGEREETVEHLYAECTAPGILDLRENMEVADGENLLAATMGDEDCTEEHLARALEFQVRALEIL